LACKKLGLPTTASRFGVQAKFAAIEPHKEALLKPVTPDACMFVHFLSSPKNINASIHAHTSIEVIRSWQTGESDDVL
jgi:hypothetical protein